MAKQAKTNEEWAREMIPVLIRWAQSSWNVPHYYSDLRDAIGHNTYHLGKPLGLVQDTLRELARKHQKPIPPPLSALVRSKDTDLPSDGFDYVCKGYENLTQEEKKDKVYSFNKQASKYDWDWVLKDLGLDPTPIMHSTQIEDIRKSLPQRGSRGESDEHKKLKKSILDSPQSLGLRLRGLQLHDSETEYILLSNDRLDILLRYKDPHTGMIKQYIAVEVKPSGTDDKEVLRGIFQCVKYKAVLDAERVPTAQYYNSDVVLVLGGKMGARNKRIAQELGIKYIEEFPHSRHKNY